MFGYNDFSIDFLSGSQVLVGLALLVLAGFAIFTYYRTNPPLPKYLRIILGTLRIMAIASLFLALLEPVISFSRQYERARHISVLIDRSDSMEKVEKEKSRRSRVDSLMSSSTISNIDNQTELNTYQFAGVLKDDAENLETDKTAIGTALYEVEKLELAEPADYRILFSDGSSNYGRSPIEAADKSTAPIIAIDMAISTAEFDIAVTDIEFNPVVFAGQPTEIKVKLGWQGKPAKPIAIRLYDSSKVVTEEKFTATQESGLAEANLKFTPDRPGQKILRISVPAQEKETTDKNNSRSFALKILKSKMSVLLAAVNPDYEVGFLKRFYENSERYEVTFIATGLKSGNLNGTFPLKQTEINQYDMIILYDPDPSQLQPAAEIIKSYLFDRGGSIWVLMGEKTASRGPVKWFYDLLPFSQSANGAIEYRQFHAEPVEGNLLHPSNRIADDQQAIRAAWTELPPFESLVKCDIIAADAVALAETADPLQPDKRWPVTGFRRHGPGKIFATAALPFWSWKFVSSGFGGNDQLYTKFVEGTSSWLTVTEDIEPVRIRPVKQVFSRGEIVRFDGFAYDLGFRPIPGATGHVKLAATGSSGSVDEDLLPKSEGEYAAEFNNLPAGKYKWSGKFEKDGRTIKEDAGEILVETYTLEEFDQGGSTVLAAIADRSGGKYFRFDQFEAAAAMIDTNPVLMSHSGEIVIWGKLWLLVLFLAALSVEWLLRKVFQLI